MELNLLTQNKVFVVTNTSSRIWKKLWNIVIKFIKIPVSFYDIEDGYKVVYPDGYTSFSPKTVFEDAYFQLRDEKGERITSEDVDNFVKDTFSAKVGSKTTNTTLVLLNDFEVHGQASCVKAENYNIEIGEKFAVEKAKDKIWEVLGFVLQWGINGIKKK